MVADSARCGTQPHCDLFGRRRLVLDDTQDSPARGVAKSLELLHGLDGHPGWQFRHLDGYILRQNWNGIDIIIAFERSHTSPSILIFLNEQRFQNDMEIYNVLEI